jgi:hypothetical protein
MTTAAASPFGDNFWKVIKQMQESLRTPALQAMVKQMQESQSLAWQEAAKEFDLARKVELPKGLDFSAMSTSILDSQNAEIQATIKRLGSESIGVPWAEIAKQISKPTLPQFAPDVQAVLANLQRELAAAHAPGFEGAADDDAAPVDAAVGFDWTDALPRKAQIRLLIALLSVVFYLTQGAAEATDTKMPPGLAGVTAAAMAAAGALNERIGPIDESDLDDEL